MKSRRVEVLLFGGCPNGEAALERARAAIREANVAANLTVVRVESDDEATRLRFLGSPTVRVDGVDVDPGAGGRDQFCLQCRVYDVSGRIEGAPPTEWIVSALRGEPPVLA
jgi:hypothetical protein